MSHSRIVKLVSYVIIVAALIYYQTVVSSREALVAERQKAIAEVEAYNASVLALQQSGEQAAAAAPAWKNGTYTGTGSGFGGSITLNVTVADGKITDIAVTDAPGEDSAYLGQAKALLDDVIARQSADVDTVSGATFSSKGLIEAVQNALGKAVA